MKIKINKEGKEVEIDCKNPLGKHTKKGFKLFTALLEDKKDNAKLINEYTDFLDEMTAELTGIKVIELDELESDEKNKLVGFYQNKIVNKVDFIKSSLKQENSQSKEKQV